MINQIFYSFLIDITFQLWIGNAMYIGFVFHIQVLYPVQYPNETSE
jgi:hypothetical protein